MELSNVCMQAKRYIYNVYSHRPPRKRSIKTLDTKDMIAINQLVSSCVLIICTFLFHFQIAVLDLIYRGKVISVEGESLTVQLTSTVSQK